VTAGYANLYQDHHTMWHC